MANKLEQQYPQFFELNGTALNDGYIYIGVNGLNPETNPIPIFLDEDLTIPISQPLRTSGGYIYYNGSPVSIYFDESTYSITVKNSLNSLIYTILSNNAFSYPKVIDTIEDLATYNGTGLVMVKDIKRGGTFVSKTAIEIDPNTGELYAVNDGTIFAMLGGGFWVRQYSGAVNVKWFGAIRLAESTSSVQAALDYAKSINGTLEIDDLYLVDTIKVTDVNGFAMIGKGALIGNATTTRDAVLEFKNCTDVTATKTLTISGNYNENYTAGVKVWAEISTGTSSLNVLKFNIVGAKLAWQFGDLSEPDVLLSEMSIGEGYTYGCPECLLVIGTQAVIGVTDYQLISGTSGGSGAWLTLPRNVIRTIGGRVQVNGGEVVLTDVTNGLTCNIQPIESNSFDNAYGKIIMSNVEVESSSQLLVTSNPNNILNTTKGLFDLSQCGGYHSQNAFPFMQTDIDFRGEVVIKQCDFYGGTPRSQATLYCLGNANVYIDEISFKKNFVQGLGAISGGIVHFSYRMILNANNLAGQTLTSGAATTLVFVSKVSDIDLNRFTLDYNALTGVFTVPTGGLKNIKIETQLLKAGLGGEWYVQINGNSHGIRELGNYSHNSYSINSLNAGDTIKIVLLNLSATTVATSAYLDYFQIFASN